MRRVSALCILLVLCVQLAACTAIYIAFYFTYVFIAYTVDRVFSSAAGLEASLTPAHLAAGQPALLEFRLPAGGPAAPRLELCATAGEVLPLLPEVYAPGGALPLPEQARAALHARYPGFSPRSGAAGAWPAEDARRADGRLPALYVAPAVRCHAEVLLYSAPDPARGAAAGPEPQNGAGQGAPAAPADQPGPGPVAAPPPDAVPAGVPLSPAGWPALGKLLLDPE
jgi:hypothetical protein